MPAALRLVRITNVAVSFAGTIVGALAGAGTGIPVDGGFWLAAGLAAVSTACVTAAGNVLNDLGDIGTDRSAHPDRPLVRGEVSVRAARALATGLFVVGGLAIVPIALGVPLLAGLFAVAVASLFLYELSAKARGLVGNACVALLTGLVFLYGGASVGAALPVAPFAAMAFFATLSREITKDIEDMAGDLDRRTLPRTRGVGVAAAASRGSIAVAIAASGLPFLGLLSPTSLAGIMYLALVLAADAVFVLSVAYLPRRLHWEQTVSKGAMAIALLAFLAVAFR
ncbi:MAG: UbiA family prenyltransferase [Thermoplasmata archaeon]